MNVDTVRLSVPCPSCHVRKPLVAAFVSEPRHADCGGTSQALVGACTRCWSQRARALNEARATLRSAGLLQGSGRTLTWRGEVLSGDHEHDGLEGALLSELLRRDIAPTFTARLTLPAAVPATSQAETTRGR